MKVLFRARKLYDTELLTGGKIYDIYYGRYNYCTTDDNGSEYKIASVKTLNESWEILKSDSEDDKFREVLLSE